MKSASEISEAFFKLADIVEKPAVEAAPSNLAVAGRYLLDPAVFSYLKDQTAGVGGEIQLTDAIRRMLAEKTVFGYIYPGHRHDIGNPNGYLKALEAMNENG
jgi:UTP--glucose-1-phosphate uridylyltransferase